MISDIVGWIGILLVIAAYFLVSIKKLLPHSSTYQILNLFGAIGIGVNVWIQKAYPSFVLQIVWGAIAIYGLCKSFKK